MNLSDLPRRFPIPFASGAGSGYKRVIPTDHVAASGTDAPASLHDGFPPETFTPLDAGGVPPNGADFNGLFEQLTAWARWQAAGGPAYFNADFAAAIGGYPLGAVVRAASSPTGSWVSIVNNNMEDPGLGELPGPTNWRFLAGLGATAAEVLERPARADRVITPYALAEASPAGIGATGRWEKLPNGRIEQWGRTSAISQNNGSVTIAFPTPFPTGCENLQLTTVNPTGAPGENYDMWAQVVSYTASDFTIIQQAVLAGAAAMPLAVDWRAVGR